MTFRVKWWPCKTERCTGRVWSHPFPENEGGKIYELPISTEPVKRRCEVCKQEHNYLDVNGNETRRGSD
jgi:hypothetical protein